MVLPFSCAVGFNDFLLGNVHINIVGCFPFLSFVFFLVGVGFGLGVLSNLGTSANTLATYGETTSSSISIYGIDFSSSVYIASVGANITLSNNAHNISGKFANTGVTFKPSKNSQVMCA